MCELHLTTENMVEVYLFYVLATFILSYKSPLLPKLLTVTFKYGFVVDDALLLKLEALFSLVALGFLFYYAIFAF